MEAAAYLSSNNRAASVTVIGNTSVPFERSLGRQVGDRIQRMFEEQGVKFVNGAGVTEISGDGGKLTGVGYVFCFYHCLASKIACMITYYVQIKFKVYSDAKFIT